MVSPAQAAKHKRDLEWAKHLESIGNTPVYTGVPVPPITAESVFASLSPPSALNTNDYMDVDNTPLIPAELQQLLPAENPDPHLPHNSHLIPENDFQPETGLGERLPSPEPFNEAGENLTSEEFRSLEDSAFQEELEDFRNVNYGQLPIKNDAP